MDRTQFAGLTRLDPADSLSEDGYSFQAQNPTIIDALLRLGARDHRHDAHAALAQPVPAPVLTAQAAGGTIPADTPLHVGYTLLDNVGGETTLNANPQLVTTQAGLAVPTSTPGLATDATAGTLLAGSYAYAVTITDGLGGETALGPARTILVPSGNPTNRIVVSGLQALVAASGGTGYRLWRAVNGGQWNLISDGAADVVTDDGSLPPNCNVAPPTSTVGNTNATNKLQVTVPAGQPAAAVSFNIYVSVDGLFSSPCLMGTYPIADAGTVKELTTLAALLVGEPPSVARTYAGAARIDARTDISNLTWQAPVATVAALPADDAAGTARVVLADASVHVFDGAAWQALGSGGGGGGALSTYEATMHVAPAAGTNLLKFDFELDTDPAFTLLADGSVQVNSPGLYVADMYVQARPSTAPSGNWTFTRRITMADAWVAAVEATDEPARLSSDWSLRTVHLHGMRHLAANDLIRVFFSMLDGGTTLVPFVDGIGGSPDNGTYDMPRLTIAKLS